MPPASGPEATAVEAEVAALIDVNDALADLVLAEGVHQGVLGNTERVSAVLDAGLAAAFPPEPSVLETPVAGLTMIQRVTLHLRAGLAPSFTPVTGLAATPRAMTAPAVNEFLTSMLPSPTDIVALVRWHADGIDHERAVSVFELGLQAIDLLALVKLDDAAALDILDDLLVGHVVSSEGLGLSTELRVAHTEAVTGSWTLFELGAPLSYLRSVTSSRPLRATDLMLASTASTAAPTPIATRAGVDLAVTRLDSIRTQIELARGPLAALLVDPVANRDKIVAAVDGAVAALPVVMAAAVEFGMLAASPEAGRSRARDLLAALRAAIATRSDTWSTRLIRGDTQLSKEASLPTLATSAERVAALAVAEHALRAHITSPFPTDPVVYRNAVATLRTQVATAHAALKAVLENATLAGSLDKARDVVAATTFDSDALDVAAVEDGCFALVTDIEAALRATVAEIDRRRSAAIDSLATFDTASAGGDLFAAQQATADAVHALLGPAAVSIPEFVLDASAAASFSAAVAWSRSGRLTVHLGRELAVDDWLHEVARVRERVRSWEQARLLATVAGGTDGELLAVQLPHADEPWLATTWPSGVTPTGEHVLFCSSFASAFAAGSAQCGLLIDEWSEFVPSPQHTSGLAFHFDSPNSEPVQAMLLVVPPDDKGWSFDVITEAIHDTLELALLRAVEPDQLASTAYGAFLPATIASATVRGVTLSANFAVNNHVLEALKVDDA